MPSAMAPELTSRTSLPIARNCAICAAHFAIAAASSPLPSLVTSEDPTLITRRLAFFMTEFMFYRYVSSGAVAIRLRQAAARQVFLILHLETRIVGIDGINGAYVIHQRFLRACILLLLLRKIIVHCHHQFFAACARQRGNLVHRPLPAKALDDILDPLGALVFRHHVELVLHQPARLLKERLVVLLQFLDDGLGFLDRVHAGIEGCK